MRASAATCLAALAILLAPAPARAQEAQGGEPAAPFRTDLDIPGDSNKYFGQRSNQYRDIGRRLAKVDLDADFNYDGTIDNDDPADNGAFQQTPPGLVLGVGELSKLILRIRPYHLDFKGRAVVSIQVGGINRAAKSGLFASPDEERASVGHIKVWSDASRSNLLLDSRDPARRVHEWTIDDYKYPANVPGIVPRSLYVEGISQSGQYNGDIRLLLMVQHRVPGEPAVVDPKSGLAGPKEVVEEEGRTTQGVQFKRFATAYDHILLTVQGGPHPKEYVNGNSEGVWKRR